MHFQNCKYSFQLKGNRRKMGRKQVGFSNNFSNKFQRGRNRTRRVWSSTPLLVEYGYVWVVPWRLCSRLPWRGNRPYLQTGKQSLLAAQEHLFVAHTSLMWTSTSPSAFCSKICSCSIQYTKRNTHQEKKSLKNVSYVCMKWAETRWWYLNAQFRIQSSTPCDSCNLPFKDLQSSTPHTSQVSGFLTVLAQFSWGQDKCKRLNNTLGTKQLHEWVQQRVGWFVFVNEETFSHNSV